MPVPYNHTSDLNKRPTLVQPSTSIWNGTHADNDRPEKKNKVQDVKILRLSFAEFCSVVAEKKSNISRSIRGQGCHIDFFDRPEKRKLG